VLNTDWAVRAAAITTQLLVMSCCGHQVSSKALPALLDLAGLLLGEVTAHQLAFEIEAKPDVVVDTHLL